MKIRLHMVNIKANYGGGMCQRCGKEEETTEHVLSCFSDGEYIFDHEKMEDISWLRQVKIIYEQFNEKSYKD